MKQGTIRIGVTDGAKVKVPINEPETIDDLQKLSRGSEQVLVRWATRGYRIECQERSGARDFVRENASLPEAELTRKTAEFVASYDPTKVVERTGRPRKPVTVTVPKGKKSMSRDEVAAMLAAAGLKVEMVDEGAS